jgi:hypothetical protein
MVKINLNNGLIADWLLITGILHMEEEEKLENVAFHGKG